jgi:hypothetical protein
MPNEKPDKAAKQRIGYGVKLPLLTLQESVSVTKGAARLGGESGSLDAFATVLENSRSSSTFFYKLSVLKSFGLITYDKLNYQLTDIGHRVVTPQSLSDESSAIYQAFQKNEILSKVWENYKGKILPAREYVANFMEKSFGIPADLKLAWSDYFIEAAKFAKLVAERGESGSVHVLYDPQIVPEKSAEIIASPQPARGIDTQAPAREAASFGDSVDSLQWGSISKPKLSSGRIAIFAIPDELSQQDIERLRTILKGVDAGLDGLKKQE